MEQLLYVVRNDYMPKSKEDRIWMGHNHSILGVFPDLKSAYDAGKKKWKQMVESKEVDNGFWMNIKVLKLGLSDYLGCSAWQIMWNKDYTEEEIQKMQQEIENWCMWKNFQYIQNEG